MSLASSPWLHLKIILFIHEYVFIFLHCDRFGCFWTGDVLHGGDKKSTMVYRSITNPISSCLASRGTHTIILPLSQIIGLFECIEKKCEFIKVKTIYNLKWRGSYYYTQLLSNTMSELSLEWISAHFTHPPIIYT